MDSKVVTDAIDRQEWLEPVAETMQSAVAAVYGVAGKKAENFLNGVWLGHPLHPSVIHIPLGAWTLASLLDAIDAARDDEALAPGADAAVAIGLVGALIAATSGLTQWYPLQERSPRRVGVTHALLNVAATGLYGASYVLRRGGNRRAGRVLGWIGSAVLNASGWLGGNLTYELKIGVDHAPRGEQLPGEWTAVLPEADLPENQLTRAEANGTPVLLLRRGGVIHALAETCSHFGGPLAEGELENDAAGGPCVVCPWHGSRFRLEDGEVVDGPATFPQPRLDVRVRDGRIEVRAPEIPQNLA